jgi:hypothetical protein
MGMPVGRVYRYVGGAELALRQGPASGAPIASRSDLDHWLGGQDRRDLREPFTFVVDLEGRLRLAPRRTEHVACAGGGHVLAAGEISWVPDDENEWTVGEVSNQSTGYCPDPDCWDALAAALDRAGLRHPGRFTHPVTFRRCEACGQRNIVRDAVFACAVCDAQLPAQWNFG